MELITAKQFSRMTGLSVRCVRKYLRQGVVPARKLGNEWFLTEDAIKAFFENRFPMATGKTQRKPQGV